MDNKVKIDRARLQVPDLPNDFVPRGDLIEYLNNNLRPITLVTGGAGYGKTTFVSSWIRQLPYNSVWLSLDESIRGPRIFFTYLIEGIRAFSPDFGNNLLELLNSKRLPPLHEIVLEFKNELTSLTKIFFLVLDDFNLLNYPGIDMLLSENFKYAPKLIYPVIISRSTPKWSLAQLEAKNMINVINTDQLRFSQEESAMFIKKNLKHINPIIIKKLFKKTEGWITGLRLAMINLSSYGDTEEIEGIIETSHFSKSYFFEELLKYLDGKRLDFLVKTSFLSNFDPGLTDYVLEVNDSESLIDEFIHKNYFIVTLDRKKLACRYHHLFQEILKEELHKRYSPDEIKKFYSKAIEWHEAKEEIAHALNYALEIKDYKKAVSLIEKYSQKLFFEERLNIILNWLNLIPDDLVDNSPALLIAKLWIYKDNSAFWAMPSLLKKLEGLNLQQHFNNELKYQILHFKAVLLFWDGKLDESITLLEDVIKHLPKEKHEAFTTEAKNYRNVASVQAHRSIKVLFDLEKELFSGNLGTTHKLKLLGGSMVIGNIIAGNLDEALKYTGLAKELGQQHNNIVIKAGIEYITGYIEYMRYNLQEAETHFKKALKIKYTLDLTSPVDTYAGLISTLHYLHKKDESEQVIQNMYNFVNSTGNPINKYWYQSALAKQALNKNNHKEALNIFKHIDFSILPHNHFFWLEQPRLTYYRTLLAQDTPEYIKQAETELDTFMKQIENTENTPVLIPSLILKAVIEKKQGKKNLAVKTLGKAIICSNSGQWLTPFVEMIKDIEDLLQYLPAENEYKNFKDKLKQCTGHPLNVEESNDEIKYVVSESFFNGKNDNKLTNREIDILLLLSKRLSNKEIAGKLFISPATVKRHTVTIYNKLKVGNRNEAVIKAVEKGILMPVKN